MQACRQLDSCLSPQMERLTDIVLQPTGRFAVALFTTRPSVSPQQAIGLINSEQGVFVDLRDAADFKQGHIVEALNIPAAKLPARMAELEKYRERPVVLVCKMGQQSGAAGKQLKAAGFNKVYKMTGGMMEWGNLQLPTVSKS